LNLTCALEDRARRQTAADKKMNNLSFIRILDANAEALKNFRI
jgi:hypothetical protein